MTTQDERPVVDRLNDAIRENPLAAGLIGAGVAWMLLGSKGLGALAGAAKTTATTAATVAGTAAAGVGGAAASAGFRAATAVRDAADVVKNAASEAKQAAGDAVDTAPLVPELPDGAKATQAMDDMSAAAGQRVRQAAASGREYGAAIQSRLSENLERQPLILGAIGLAIGAGIAASFATTAAEKEWIGRSADAVRDKVGNAVSEHARQVISDVRNEAERQGLTPDAIKETASSMAGKARNVAQAARDSAKQPFAPRS